VAGRDAGPAEIAAILADPDRRFVLTSHRNPDGDAIGSMLGLARAMRARDLDVVLAHPDADPVPGDLAFMVREGEDIPSSLPSDVGERTLVTLDCASEGRLWQTPEHERAGLLVNVDHHQDNTRFGDLNLVQPTASSCAEVVVHLLDAAGWPLTLDVAEPLYVGLITDTGRFCYANTGAEAHRVAARMVEIGLDISAIARRLYEEQPPERMVLLGRALGRAQLRAGGRLMLSALSGEDFVAAGGDDSEGIVEVLREMRGVEVAGLVREAGPDGSHRVSLRSADGTVDVSSIARLEGGGGHRAAAGFSSAMPQEELLEWITERVGERLDGSRDGGADAG
jgi:phosphoesterase RecJ-like protein